MAIAEDIELDQLTTKKHTARGTCPRCGKRSTKGFIQMNVQAYGDEKSAKGARHIKSKGRSMCGRCIKAVWKELAETFDREVNG